MSLKYEISSEPPHISEVRFRAKRRHLIMVLERNAASIINAPEYGIDFSVEYDLTYSADVIEVRAKRTYINEPSTCHRHIYTNH